MVVTHEASRTGAPRVALEVLRSLAPVSGRRVAVLRWGGPLTSEFAREADRAGLEPLRRARAALRRWPRGRRLANLVEQIAAAAVLLRHRPDLVWLNTVKSACYVRPAVLLRRNVVLHVHELEPLASGILGRYHLARYWPRIRLVACSTGVAANLSRVAGVAPEDVAVIPSAVDIGAVERRGGPVPAGGGDGILTVGACGTADEGKGADLWLEMAAEVLRRSEPGSVRFVWVGRPQLADLERRIDALGLRGHVDFAGDLANPYPVMAAMDVFTHPARQDSFPLAVIEAMVLGRPVVAFDVGGLADQLGEVGRLVPAGDVAAMAGAVVELAADAEARRRLGEQARARAVRFFGMEAFRAAIAALVADPSAVGRDRPGAGRHPRSGPPPP